MATTSHDRTIEGFVIDAAFVDLTKATSGVFTTEVGQVAALTSRVLSYFSDPVMLDDKRAPASRAVNWSPVSNPRIVLDNQVFSVFTDVVNNLSTSGKNGFFKLVDRLFFNYALADSRASIETFLTTDTDIKEIYVPNSFSVSQQLVSDTVYLDNNSTKLIQTPSFIDFKIKLTVGTTTTNFVVKLYTSVEAWIKGYSISTIVKVIPPLPYDKIYSASLTNSNDNIFSTATMTANLSYTTTQALLGTVSVSGISEYKAILTDGVNVSSVPFNLLYKGRKPTLLEIRNALKAAFANSGVGNEAGWRKRVPGVYVEGRFYVVPLWDKTYVKPDQVIYPNILPYLDFSTTSTKILSSLGYGDFTPFLDVFTVYYNRMSAVAIPDMSGTIAIDHLSKLIPDYQNCAPSDEQFAYMNDVTRNFSSGLNMILAIDSGVQFSTVYTPDQEGLLSFYSFTVGSYEICVITKECYETIMESIA